MTFIKLEDHINWIIDAHQNYPKKPGGDIRYWDKKTPYSIHPIWCAMTMLTETKLPEELRINGAIALLYHDVLEDTTKGLPDNLPSKVVEMISDMTFHGGIEEENIKQIADTGADEVAVGSSLFNGSVEENMRKLQNAL